MNRVAFLWLIVATLVGCSGGSKSAPNTPDPDPGPVVPTPISGGLARLSEERNFHFGGSGSISSNSTSAAPLQAPVDWIELQTPPFAHDEAEFFLLHLATPADELTWHTSSPDYVEGVHSDRGHTEYFGDDDFYDASSFEAGVELWCIPRGYEFVWIRCKIRRGETSSTVSTTLTPRHVPPRPGGMIDYGIVGTTGEERLWNGGVAASDEFQWDFGGGATPNTVLGPRSPSSVLGAPGRYTGNYTVRNEWGTSGPQQFGYWVQPALETYPLGFRLYAAPSLLLFNDRLRILIPTEGGYQYGEALVAEPKSTADWRFSDLPMPATHSDFMQMGVHAGKLLIIGGHESIESDDLVVYYQAAVPSPASTSDWDVGGIPGSDGLQVLAIEIEADRVGLLVRQDNKLMLLWDATPVLSEWEFSEIAQHPPQSRFDSNSLLLTDSGPVLVGFNLLPGEPSGFMYRSARWDAPEVWSAHSLLKSNSVNDSDMAHAACIYQGRPLVLGRLDRWSSTLLWSSVPNPNASSQWVRLVTCQEITPDNWPALMNIDVRDDRVVMSFAMIRHPHANGSHQMSRGGLLLQGALSDLSHWTPFLAPSPQSFESIYATVFSGNGVALLAQSDDEELSFGMLTP